MCTPLFEHVSYYGAAVAIGIVVAFILRGHFANRLQNKIRGYQADIVKSHAKILELEELNDKLEKRLQETSASFSTDKILMN